MEPTCANGDSLNMSYPYSRYPKIHQGIGSRREGKKQKLCVTVGMRNSCSLLTLGSFQAFQFHRERRCAVKIRNLTEDRLSLMRLSIPES